MVRGPTEGTKNADIESIFMGEVGAPEEDAQGPLGSLLPALWRDDEQQRRI